jgi:FkbM family methyltransferase
MISESRRSYFIPFVNPPFFGRARKLIAVDLGLNVGSFPYVFGKGYSRIVSLEASGKCIAQAKTNLVDRSNIEYVHAAGGAESGFPTKLRRISVEGLVESKDFTTAQWDTHELELSGYSGRFDGVEETVSSISFADFSQLIGAKIHFLKCDIEGAEYDFLFGRDLSSVRFLVMELHYTALGKERVRRLLDSLEKHLTFLSKEDEQKFRKNWPPPEILRMRNKNQRMLLASIGLQILNVAAKFLRLVRNKLVLRRVE